MVICILLSSQLFPMSRLRALYQVQSKRLWGQGQRGQNRFFSTTRIIRQNPIKPDVPATPEGDAPEKTTEFSFFDALKRFLWPDQTGNSSQSAPITEENQTETSMPINGEGSKLESDRLFDIVTENIQRHVVPEIEVIILLIKAIKADNNRTFLNKKVDDHLFLYWCLKSLMTRMAQKVTSEQSANSLDTRKINEYIDAISELHTMGAKLDKVDKELLKQDVLEYREKETRWLIPDHTKLKYINCIARYYKLCNSLKLIKIDNKIRVNIDKACRFADMNMDDALDDIQFSDIGRKNYVADAVSKKMRADIFNIMLLLGPQPLLGKNHSFRVEPIKAYILGFKNKSANGKLKREVLAKIIKIAHNYEEENIIKTALSQQYDVGYKPNWGKEFAEIYSILLKDSEIEASRALDQYSLLYKLQFLNSERNNSFDLLFSHIKKESAKYLVMEDVEMLIELALQSDRNKLNTTIDGHSLLFFVFEKMFDILWECDVYKGVKNTLVKNSLMNMIDQLVGAGCYLNNKDKNVLRTYLPKIATIQEEHPEFISLGMLIRIARFYKLLIKLGVVDSSNNSIIDVKKCIELSEIPLNGPLADIFLRNFKKTDPVYDQALFIHSLRKKMEEEKERKEKESEERAKNWKDEFSKEGAKEKKSEYSENAQEKHKQKENTSQEKSPDEKEWFNEQSSSMKNLRNFFVVKKNIPLKDIQSAVNLKKAFGQYSLSQHPDRVKSSPKQQEEYKKVTDLFNDVKKELNKKIMQERRAQAAAEQTVRE
jgi:hypothetical protein